MTAVSGIVLLIGIFATAYSRRVLGPAAIGQVNWNAALLAFLALLASPGLALVGQRDIAANPKQTASITSLVLGLQMLFGLRPTPSSRRSRSSIRAAGRPAPCC